jgi:two-component system, NarL family, response regulator DesR
MTANKIRVVIAEDQRMVLGALAALLSLEDDIEVVAQATDGPAAVAMVREHQPDVLITDVEMPGMSGLDVARLLQGESRARVMVLTNFARAGYLRRALEAGVSGYVLKAQPAEELADAVRRVHRGLRVIDPQLAAESWSGDADPLTARQREILLLAAEGASTADIAARLGLSAGTVRNYLSEAILKLGAANRIEAARIARSKGWL